MYNGDANTTRITEEIKLDTQAMNDLIKSDNGNASLSVYKRVYNVIPFIMTVSS